MKKVFLAIILLLTSVVSYASVQLTMIDSASIRVCEGGTLIVDGGTIQDADIQMIPGSTLIVRNNGKINMAVNKHFNAPFGVFVNIENGEIN